MKVDRLKMFSAMDHAKINMKEIAAKSGISRNLVSKAFNGGSVKYESLKSIAEALGVSVADIAEESTL